MDLLVGTSGYSYKEWRGSFYPEKLSAKEMLRFYAQRLRAVEINNTFYRLPRTSVLEGWAEQVPESFRFAIKASRRITHIRRLKDAGDETEYLVRATSVLGDRLGVILFQLPPYLRKDIDLLGDFLDRLPSGAPAAFEFRHRSWFDEETFTRLRDHGCALCIADTGEEAGAPVVATAPWGYVRLRRESYGDEELTEWIARLGALGWSRAFIFFKHEGEGEGPRLAARLAELAAER